MNTQRFFGVPLLACGLMLPVSLDQPVSSLECVDSVTAQFTDDEACQTYYRLQCPTSESCSHVRWGGDTTGEAGDEQVETKLYLNLWCTEDSLWKAGCDSIRQAYYCELGGPLGEGE